MSLITSYSTLSSNRMRKSTYALEKIDNDNTYLMYQKYAEQDLYNVV